MTKRVVVRLPSGSNVELAELLSHISLQRDTLDELEEIGVTTGRRSGVSWGRMAGFLKVSERGLAKRHRGV